MNKNAPRLLLAVLALFAFGHSTRAASPENSRVVVTFENPDRFTDVQDSISGTEKGRDHYLKQIRVFIEEAAHRLLPKGAQMEIRFTDLDLAGDYLPSMPSNRNIRVLKDIYPPRAKFAYKITSDSGAVVKEGEESLTDLNYLQTPGIHRNEELFYEKALLRDWLNKTLR